MTTAPSLPQLVRETRERLTALLASTDRDAAAWVERVRTARPQTPTVVVVGETKRGKSSLVNALLATQGLSRVDAEVATDTYVVLRYGASWTTHIHDRPPRHVEVQAPIPLLDRLTLVDSPGVGGLDAAHGELAAEAAEAATALLFVVDAAAPFTSGELGFLRRLSERVETVVFALTKVDLHRGWRQILEADRALLATHAPRFAGAQFHPVSARLFESAAAAPTAEVAALLRERSGVADLQAALQRQVGGRAVMLGEANVLRAIATALAGVIAGMQARQRVLVAAAEGQPAGEASAGLLHRRRDELTAQRRAGGRGWQLRLRGELQRTRLASLHDVATHARAAQTWFRRAVDEADRDTLARLPYQLDAALQVMSVRITAGLAQRLSRVVDTALAELFTPAELDAALVQFTRRGGAAPPVILRPPDRRPAGVEDKLLVAMGVSGGLGLGRVAAQPLAGLALTGLGAAAGIAVLPVTIVLGLGAGWWMARARRHAADKAHLKQWLADVLAEARAALDQAVAEQMIDAEQQLTLALDDAIGRRVAAIEEELREVDRALRLDAAAREHELAEVRATLAAARAGRERAEQLLGRIGELRDRT
ncbi:MAG TPA: GTPase [Pseudonocardiaceae bacterium]|jgi:GTP-binding protein EngB required for normal cell division